MLEVRGAVNVTARAKFFDHAHFSLRPRLFCVLNAVGQEFVGRNCEKTNCKSGRICYLYYVEAILQRKTTYRTRSNYPNVQN